MNLVTCEINQACSMRLTKLEELSYESTVEATTRKHLEVVEMVVAEGTTPKLIGSLLVDTEKLIL